MSWSAQKAAILVATLLAAPMAVVSCSDRKQPAPAAAGSVQTYTTRGVVVQLPEAGKPANLLQIHHETIPDFVNQAGDTVGMPSHPMPFPSFAPGVAISGLALGDKVEFTFEVTWGGSTTYRVTRIMKLDPETPLALGGHPGG